MKTLTLKAWLRKWRRRKYVHGRCAEACTEGVHLFSLRPVAGIVADKPGASIADVRSTHWWLVDAGGAILDPTVHQFPAIELVYIPFLQQPAMANGHLPFAGDDAPRWYNIDRPTYHAALRAWVLRVCGVRLHPSPEEACDGQIPASAPDRM